MKVNAIQYSKLLYEVTAGKSRQDIDNIIVKFTALLIKNRQIKLIGKIIEKFSEIYNKKNGIVEADVITRYKIQDIMIKQIEKFVKEKYKVKEVVLNSKIDENIKGGIIIKVGDEIVDASISGKLRSLKSSLEK